MYFTGGFAYGNKTNEFTGNRRHKHRLQGRRLEGRYVLGGGVEYKFNPAWSVKAEYQYIDLGHDNAADAAGNYVHTVDTELSTVRAGVNYHFGSSYAPLK